MPKKMKLGWRILAFPFVFIDRLVGFVLCFVVLLFTGLLVVILGPFLTLKYVVKKGSVFPFKILGVALVALIFKGTLKKLLKLDDN